MSLLKILEWSGRLTVYIFVFVTVGENPLKVGWRETSQDYIPGKVSCAGFGRLFHSSKYFPSLSDYPYRPLVLDVDNNTGKEDF